jgi:hypothetical protein
LSIGKLESVPTMALSTRAALNQHYWLVRWGTSFQKTGTKTFFKDLMR